MDEEVARMLQDGEFAVKVLPGSRAVVITFTKDDATVAMNLKVAGRNSPPFLHRHVNARTGLTSSCFF